MTRSWWPVPPPPRLPRRASVSRSRAACFVSAACPTSSRYRRRWPTTSRSPAQADRTALGSDGTDFMFATLNSAAAALTASPASAAARPPPAPCWPPKRGMRDGPGTATNRTRRPLRERPPSSRIVSRGRSATAMPIGLARRYGRGRGARSLLADPRPPGCRTRRCAQAYPRQPGSVRLCAGRGLTAQARRTGHAARALRTLDRVDTVVIDPRVLYTDKLIVSRVRGLSNSAQQGLGRRPRRLERTASWTGLASECQASRAPDAGEALVSPVRDPYAARRRRRGAARRPPGVSLADDGLRSLAQGFDHLHPLSATRSTTRWPTLWPRPRPTGPPLPC